MSRSNRWGLVGLVALVFVQGCGSRVATEDLPTTRETLDAIGLRLGRLKSPGDLTDAARRGDLVLGLLNRQERDALGRCAIRFRVDRPAVVEIAAPATALPFWLADQGFRATGTRLHNEDGDLIVYRKSFPTGMIGLGVNALDRTSPTHYAVILKAEGDTVGNPVVTNLTPADLRVVPFGSHVSPQVDAIKPFDTTPAGWPEALIIQTRHESRHDGLLATGRVWKTHQPSSALPDQVVVSFGNDPTRELSITWRTDTTVTGSSVRIAPQDSPESIQRFAGQAHHVRSVGLLNDPTILRHQVQASNLEPDTAYRYAVGDGSESGWGRWQTIRTAPSTLRDFSFLYLGDAQCGLERWGDLLHAARKHRPDAGFLLLAGDLVDRGNERTNWDHFFLRAAGVFEEIPFMPAVGNHEYLDEGPKLYRGTFDLPDNGPPEVDSNLVYSFEYSDAFVGVLDSNLGIYDSKLAQVQATWLDQELTRTRATWKFVMFHHPIHASHVKRENPELLAAWGPTFDKHHVDMVFQGHDHAYLRTLPMREGRPIATTDEGTVYVVSVSGEKFYDQDPRGYTAKGITNLATYQTIDIQVKEKLLKYRSFDRDGKQVDALVIDKKQTSARLAGH